MKKIILSLLLILGITTASHAANETFTIPTVKGKLLRFKGIPEGLITEPYQGKIVFLEFWATWCGPCLMSIPHHVKLQEKYKDQLRVVAIETSPKVSTAALKTYISDPKNIELNKVQWYLDNKAHSASQKAFLEAPVKELKAFREAGKPINYDVISYADAGQFMGYIAQRAGWQGSIPFLLVLDGQGKAVSMVPGMPTEEKLEGIIQSILKKK